TVFMLNMDMIGRSAVIESGGLAAAVGVPIPASGGTWKVAQRLVINGVKTADDLEKIVAEQTKDAGFALVTRDGGTGPSDHDSFYRKGVPVLFLYTGTHRDYHKPSDTPDKVDLPGVLQVVDLVQGFTERIAAAPTRPKYVKIAEKWTDPTEPPEKSSRRSGPKLGIMPGNYEAADGGVLVDDVSPGGAAEIGGIRAGDVIVEIGGRPVKNIGGYMAAMAAQKAGQEVDVTVIRKDKKLGVKVTPKE
ncbi:MAG: PDZ domain-containing protein, partial [Fimbriiglobus sp.]